MNCENCQKEHTDSYASGRFCRIECARSYASSHNNPEVRKVGLDKARRVWNQMKRDKSRSKPCEKMTRGTRRLVIIEEQMGKCAACETSEWCGKPLSLELDHIDGNSTNNIRENLRMLCPNCHSQTPTFRWKGAWRRHGKNMSKKRLPSHGGYTIF